MQMIAKHMIHLWRAENNAQADKRLFDGLCEYRAAQATCFFSFLLICEGNSKTWISKSAKKKSLSVWKLIFWLLENFLFYFLYSIQSKKIDKFLKCVIITVAITIFVPNICVFSGTFRKMYDYWIINFSIAQIMYATEATILSRIFPDYQHH